MTVKELMERVGITETGRAVAYIKDGLEELNMISETNIRNEKIDITEDQRFYDIPNEVLQLLEVRVLNHLTTKSQYRRVPRLLYKPIIKDADGS
tara:strand:- start:503 stop:784 length:282 start_codon:yes stop_codon:yes gene_type:complete